MKEKKGFASISSFVSLTNLHWLSPEDSQALIDLHKPHLGKNLKGFYFQEENRPWPKEERTIVLSGQTEPVWTILPNKVSGRLNIPSEDRINTIPPFTIVQTRRIPIDQWILQPSEREALIKLHAGITLKMLDDEIPAIESSILEKALGKTRKEISDHVIGVINKRLEFRSGGWRSIKMPPAFFLESKADGVYVSAVMSLGFHLGEKVAHEWWELPEQNKQLH